MDNGHLFSAFTIFQTLHAWSIDNNIMCILRILIVDCDSMALEPMIINVLSVL